MNFFTMRVAKHWHSLRGEVVPGNILGHVGQGYEQPDPVEDVPAHCRGLGLDDPCISLPTQQFYASVINLRARSPVLDIYMDRN